MSAPLPTLVKKAKSEPARPQIQPDLTDTQLGEEPSVDCPDFLQDDRPTTGHRKVKGMRAINTPVAPIHVDRRFFPKDMRGLLEIYEQGYTLQQGLKSNVEVTTDALGDLAGRCEGSVQVLMDQMADILLEIQRQVDRPANVDWTCVISALSKIDAMQPDNIAKNIEKCLSVHTDSILEIEHRMEEKLAAKIYGMDDAMIHREAATQQEMEKLRAEVLATQQLCKEHCEAVNRTESQLTEAFTNQHRALKTDFAQHVTDVLRLQEKNRRADMAKVEPLIEEQLTSLLGKHHQNIKASVAQNIEDLLEVQTEQGRHISEIEPFVKKQLAKHFDNQKAVDEAARFQVKEIHKTVHEDVGHLFNEIGKIQRAMNLDYVGKRKEKARHDEVRLREIGSQTEAPPVKEGITQTDEAYFKQQKRKEEKKKQREAALASKKTAQLVEDKGKTFTKKSTNYADGEKKKAKMREALIKPSYNVAHFYHNRGCAQRIARSQYFENCTFFIIFANAIWIAVDTDHNDAVVLLEAHPVFQIVENVFCTYFTLELTIRFLAFNGKRRCLKDTWFVFDMLLVLGMIVETWVVTIILLFLTNGGSTSAEGVGNFSVLRMARLVKILRMARMARLLRMVPELVVIMKSIGAAFRSVSFFLLLTMIILYVYAVGFRQLTKDSNLGDEYFETVPVAMNNLLLRGMLPLYAVIVTDISEENALYWPLIMTFILLASVTVMNMLVGVLCEVVRTVADREKEAMTIIHVTNELREVMQMFLVEGVKDKPGSGPRAEFASRFSAKFDGDLHTRTDTVKAELTHRKITAEDIPDMSKETFETFLGTPQVISLLRDCGVDAVALIDSMDMIFEEKVRAGVREGLRFVDFVEVTLNMRGTNPATVKDVKEQMRLVKMSSQDYSTKTTRMITGTLAKFHQEIMVSLHELRRVVDSDAGSEDGGSMHLGWGNANTLTEDLDDEAFTLTQEFSQIHAMPAVGDGEDEDQSDPDSQYHTSHAAPEEPESSERLGSRPSSSEADDNISDTEVIA